MPIPDQVIAGDSGHIQDHNDISDVLTGYESRIGQLETDFDLLPAPADIATESYVDSTVNTAVSSLINSAPSALNTLDELAQALGDDANFASTVTTSLSQKQPLDDDLTAIAALSGTSGLLRKTAANTWTLDTTSFAATSYVTSSINNAISSYLPLAGGTLTGQLSGTTGIFSGNISAANPTQNGHLATKSYVDTVASGTLATSITVNAGTGISGGGQVTLGGTVSLSNSGILSISGTSSQISVSTVNGAANISLANNVAITGNVSAQNPTASNHLATKFYVDGVGNSANSYTDSSLAVHSADTTSVHGIADTTLLATKAYADNAASVAVSNIIDSAPTTLNTLNELAAALNDDPNFATTVTTQIGTKANQSDLNNHTNATTNVHGISNTASLATKSYADSAKTEAISTSAAYTDTKVLEITGFVKHTARATWTGSAIQSSTQSASVGILTVTFPVGKFSSAPKVFTQNIDDGSSSRMAYAKFTPYSITSSSVSMQVINQAPPSTVSGGGSITKAIVDIWAVQE